MNNSNYSMFRPSIQRNALGDGILIANRRLSDSSSSFGDLSGSWKYDPIGSGLKSTQQLNVDFSKFSNHVFFNSAMAKTQLSFDRVINNFPFDGTKAEIEKFVDSLSGFEKFVFEQFPRCTGTLHFSGSNSSLGGSSISINDTKGTVFSSLSKNASGAPVLDPGSKSFSIEMYVKPVSGSAAIENRNQILIQKIGNNSGFTLGLSQSSSTQPNSSSLVFIVNSGSSIASASMLIPYGQFTHIVAAYDKRIGHKRIEIFSSGKLQSTSSQIFIDNISTFNSKLTIASGTIHSGTLFEFSPLQTFSGTIDEFRFFHDVRTSDEQINYGNREIFPTENLKLYYKFNESTGSYTNNSYVLDSSGNGFHSQVTNFSSSFKTIDLGSLSFENTVNSVTLFPTHPDVVSLHNTLITSASDYDANNPNLITRLIPRHYLLEASENEGFSGEDAQLNDDFGSSGNFPAGGKMPQAQIISSLLFMWALHFDDIKLFIDEFSKLLKVDVKSEGTIPDQFLSFLGNYYGVRLPNPYANSSISQMIEGNNTQINPTTAQQPLRTLQAQIWRRILSDMPNLVRSRGTMQSLRSILSDIGIDPDGPIKIKEHGGLRERDFSGALITKIGIQNFLNFSGTLAGNTSTSSLGMSLNKPYLKSPFLSGSRVEPGIPNIQGTIISGKSNNRSDGLFTSGSWSAEGFYQFDSKIQHLTTQSLLRMYTTGTSFPANSGSLLINVLALRDSYSGSNDGSIIMYGRPSTSTALSMFTLQLTGVNIFDGNPWHILLGRKRNDSIGSIASSSYFLSASKASGNTHQINSSNSILYDESNSFPSLFSVTSDTQNSSGSYMLIGSSSIYTSASSLSLNDSSISNLARHTEFTGKVGQLRFWSKALSHNEGITHALSFKSLGVIDPLVNFEFVTTRSGSFEKLRFSYDLEQPITQSSSGVLPIIDFSQNNMSGTATNFEDNKSIIVAKRSLHSLIDTKVESASSSEKIRIRSLQNSADANRLGISIAPLYAIPQNEEPVDDNRLSIEISVISALNEDIARILSTLEAFDEAVGPPELVFSVTYPKLQALRDVYFNRLTDKMNITKLFRFFKWFDEIAGEILEQMIPAKTKFLGTNFVIESHSLERSKFIYSYFNQYVGENDRSGQTGTILLQQLTSDLRKF